MDHRPFERITDRRDTAVLMVHGIAGTPAHFAFLMPALPEDISVCNILLDGHGGTVSDFSRTSMKKWKAQFRNRLDALLREYDRVFIVGHSMGTLFAIQAAVDYPDRIPAMLLLSPPLRPWVRFSTMNTALRVALGLYSDDDRRAREMAGATSVRLERKLWKYIGWLPRGVELLGECRRVRKILPALRVPAQAYHARRDELVSLKSMRDMENHPFIQNTVLEQSGHFAYGEDDGAIIRNRFAGMLEACR